MKSLTHKFLENKFWKLISAVDSINENISFSELISHLGVQYKVSDIEESVNFLKKFGFPVKIEKKPQESWIILTGDKTKFNMNLSLSEWIAIQAHFPLLDENKEKNIYNSLAQSFTRLEKKYPQADLYKYIDEEEVMGRATKNIGHDKGNLLKAINEACLRDEKIHFMTKDERKIDLYIHKVVYIDGILSIVGEDTNDRCLNCIDFDSIERYSVDHYDCYSPNFASAEVDDFISAIRSISGSEQRLVIRVSAPDKVNLRPDFHFLGNPFVTTNMEGDFIWAASVEVSDELYKWLATIYSDIDVIDPSEVREDLESFMEKKDCLTHLKKAS